MSDSHRFEIDRQQAIEAISRTWSLDQSEPWAIDQFGRGLAHSVELLCGCLFAPTRGLVDGPDAEVRIYALADAYDDPVLICVSSDDGPMLAVGVEDLGSFLDQSRPSSPDGLIDSLQALLDLASDAYSKGFRPGAPVLKSAPDASVEANGSGPARLVLQR